MWQLRLLQNRKVTLTLKIATLTKFICTDTCVLEYRALYLYNGKNL